jgi:hypothetical protein
LTFLAIDGINTLIMVFIIILNKRFFVVQKSKNMKHLNLIIVVGLSLFISSCKDKTIPQPEPISETPSYQIPSTYNFANVNYGGQTTRLDMMGELATYMKTANTKGTVISATVMKNMFNNTNSPFTAGVLNTSGKKLQDKVYSAERINIEAYMDSLALISNVITNGSNGVAGVVVSSADASKKYLCSANGVEYAQFIDKGMFGSLIYFQAMSYLENLAVKDNSIVVSGEGTVMEHNADEAFGYFGVPVDFPTNVSGLRSWGNYCNRRDIVLSTNKTIMDAFLLLRAAISNKDYTKRDEAVKTIKDTWEKVIAATFINYMNTAKNNITDDAIRNHNLSEGVAFLKSLSFRSDKKISNAQLTQAIDFLGNNFYTIKSTDIESAKGIVSSVYGLDNVKNNL